MNKCKLNATAWSFVSLTKSRQTIDYVGQLIWKHCNFHPYRYGDIVFGLFVIIMVFFSVIKSDCSPQAHGKTVANLGYANEVNNEYRSSEGSLLCIA